MKTILITGGTGLIGTALSQYLTGKGCQVIILSRHPKQVNGNISYAAWDPAKQTIDNAAIQKADYIVHLAGAGVNDKRWSKKRKQEILDSRVQSGQLIVKALREIPNQIKAVLSISGIAWYGDDAKRQGKPAFTETDLPDNDYLGQVCVQWEEAIRPVEQLGKRLAIFRCPPVFSNAGGAFKEFKKPVPFGIAAILGNGRQVISWIHIEDLVRMFWFAIENENIQGIYNAASPQPISNKEFTLQLAQKIKNKNFIPIYVPAWVLKLVFGGVSVEVLKSATISNEKISQEGFQFLYPSVDTALDNLLS
jgi:TIGR01777 family protein